MVKEIIKKIVFLVLVITFTVSGFTLGYFLVNSELIAFFINLPQHYKYSFILLSTLIALVIGILLSPLIIRGAVKVIALLMNEQDLDEKEIKATSPLLSAKLIFKFKKNFLQILQWGSLNVVIDNKKTIKAPWFKKVLYEIKPGNHKIQISIPYLGSEIGVTNIDFNINKYETMEFTYKPPLTVFGPGTILPRKVK